MDTLVSTSRQPIAQRPLAGPTPAEAAVDDRRDENRQMLLDAVKLRSEVLASQSSVAKGVNGGLKVVSSYKNATQDDKFYAASSAISAMEKLTPALSRSVVGASTSAVVLALGDDELRKQHASLAKNMKKALDETHSRGSRTKAAVDAALSASELAVIGRAVGKATANVGRYGLKAMSQVKTLAPVVGKTELALAKAAATPVGRSLAFANKWIPLLNITWVGLSAKTAIDVHKDPKSSGASKALSIASLGTSTAVFGAGFLLSGWAFAGVTVGSLAVDLALAYSRKRDAANQA